MFITDYGDDILLVVHHMIIDVVSWNIIAEDLTQLYHAHQQGKNLHLQEKTMSLKEWSDIINSEDMKREVCLAYAPVWRELSGRNAEDIFERREYGLFQDTISTEFTINTEITKQLKTHTYAAVGANMEEVLLSIVINALADVRGIRSIPLDLESTGRLIRYKDYDISRTVGWFTAIYPIVFEADSNIIKLLCETKEKRRKVQNLEYTFGVLKYADDVRETFANPQISFNYLGEISQKKEGFTRVDKAIGNPVGEGLIRQYAMDISCKIVEGQLYFTVACAARVVEKTFVDSLIWGIRKQIEMFTEVCRENKKPVVTPSDYGIKISMDELEYLRVIYGSNIETIMHMTPMQRGMMYHAISNPRNSAYHENLVMELSGTVNPMWMKEAVRRIQKNHIALRTAFVSENLCEAVQIVLKDKEVSLEYKDAEYLGAEEMAELVNTFNSKDFNYSKGDLCRFMLLKKEKGSYQLYWNFHHLILDGWSVSILQEELFQQYTSLITEERQTENAKESVTGGSGIIDGSMELYGKIGSRNMFEAKNYWNNNLGNVDMCTKIPFEKPSEETLINEMDIYLDKDYTEKLSIFALHNITTASVVMSAWGLMLQMVNLSDEAVFGSIVSGRGKENESSSNAVGMFINTIPVQSSMKERESFTDSAKRFQQNLVNAENYSYYPLYEIQSDVNKGNPVINHVVAYENYPVNRALMRQLESGHEVCGFAVKNVILKEHTNYNLGVVFTPGRKLKLNLSYNEAAISKTECKQIAYLYFEVLKQVIDNPFILKKNIHLLPEKQVKEMVCPYKPAAFESLMEQFANAGEKYGNIIAVKDDDRSFTYTELSLLSNGLAQKLSGTGLKADQVVCLMCSAGAELAIGILGIMKANAVYCPIDVKLPLERIRYMLENSNAVHIVCDKNNFNFAEQFNLPVTVISPEDRSNDNIPEEGENAYIIYTSGTTGRPKGVLVSRDNIASAIGWRRREYGFTSRDRILQLFSYSFDGFMTSFFTPLVSGSGIVFTRDVLDVARIGHLIEQEEITHFISVPMLCQSIFENLTSKQLKSIRIINTAGDRLSEQTYKAIKEKNQEIEVVNEYGPTECSVVSTIKRNVTYQDIENNSIGIEIGNAYLYVVDKYMNILPDGLAGEIVIGGQGVSRGYVNALDQTNASFLPDKYHLGLTVYRTGDKGIRMPNGEISYLGRVDKQVKVRGYRIETLEIEKNMETMDELKAAAVIVHEHELVAYFVGEIEISKIKGYLTDRLPGYMIPGRFIQLEEMPQTYIGKVDYKSLPNPQIEERQIIMPKTEMEWEIYRIWESALGHQNFGISDNFFEVGGNSIRLMSVFGKLNQAYPDKFTAASLFSHVTIRDIAGFLQEEKNMAEAETKKTSEEDILNYLEDADADLDELINNL